VLARTLPLAAATAVAAGLAAASSASAPGNTLSGATARTMAGSTASFSLSIVARVAGVSAVTHERGAVSFRRQAAHVYRLDPGGGVPREIILTGPWEYTNANVQAALDDPTVRPWTKLDTRRLPAAQLRNRADELAHVRALAFLPSGVARATRLGLEGPTTHYRGVVAPARVLLRVPATERAAIRSAIVADYSSRPFPADFWIDRRGRVVRVRVSYRTAKGGRIAVSGTFSHFGVKVDLRLPPAGEIVDVSP
jgi:hypothetical protein